eukprot:2785778-Pleurochrysis_carterae.AAC.1
MVEISKNASGRFQQRRCGAAHCPAQHAHSVRYVWASLRGAVQERAYQGLVLLKYLRRRRVVCFGRGSRVDEFGKFVGGGSMRAVNRRRHSVRQEGINHVLYVTGLCQRDVSVVTLYLDV